MYPQKNYKPDVDHIYTNLTLYNDNGPGSIDQYVPARITQAYDRAIIKNPEEWNISVVRFSISSDSIGLVYQPYPTTSANTEFYVGLSYNGVYYDQPIVLPVTLGPDGLNIQTVYSIFDLLDLINAGYGLATASVNSAGGPTGATGDQVLMTYSPVTELYSVCVPSVYGTGGIGTPGNGVGIHMSYGLYHLFNSFSALENDPILWNHHDITLIRAWRGNNRSTTVVNPVGTIGSPYMLLEQYAPWASSIQGFDRLIITSSNIPTVLEYRSEQLTSQFGNGNNGNRTLNIISDFFIGNDSQVINRAESWTYTPSVYRISSLQGNSPITQIDIQVFIGFTDGSIRRLFVGPKDNIDIKLLFLKKGLES